MNKVNCEGCLHFQEPNFPCGVPFQKFNHICPCATCLVKMVCKSECPEFIWYYGYTRHSINIPERKGVTDGLM